MAYHNEIGKAGEEVAYLYFMSKGYDIRHVNWRFSRAEIDLIAYDQEVLVFIEVKTRRNADFGNPEEFVTNEKENLMYDAATAYMQTFNHDWEIRFDIFSLIIEPRDKSANCELKYEHFKDAFFSCW